MNRSQLHAEYRSKLASNLARGAIAAAISVSLSAVAAVPNPTVTGPIASGPVGDASHNYPMSAVDPEMLARVGYVEQEYFVSGKANCYTNPRLTTGSIVASNQPFKTRILVRKPADPAKFSGVVFVEWLNASNGYDIDSTWAATSEEAYIRSGAAWVGVTVQDINVQFLRKWSPDRYGTLDVEPSANSVCRGSADSPVSPAIIGINNTAFDIMSQVAQSIRNPSGTDPLAGYSRRVIIAAGASQSSARLVPYINSVHPIAPVYDGFFLAIPVFDHLIRTDLPQKVFKVMSEFDVTASNVDGNEQADTSNIRTWQIAGAPHTTYQNVVYRLPGMIREGLPSIVYGCTLPAGSTVISRIPSRYVFAAAAEHLVNWITKGTSPPTAPRITTQTGTVQIIRDTYGNALGGIRLSQHDVATATNVGVGCSTYGSHTPFSKATLGQLYASHTSYLDAVKKVTAANLAAGYIQATDAQATLDEADKSKIVN